MHITLGDKVALVTGASRGIGKEIAFTLARAGAEVILAGRNKKNLEMVRDEMSRQKLFSRVAVFDVTSSESVRDIFSTFGRLDILINNAGGAEKFGSFFELTDEDWMAAYQLNFLGAVYMCREAVPLLRSSTAPRIVNIASIPAHQPGQYNPHYSAAKAALLNLSKHLANILAQDGILVNAICPSTLKGGGWDRNVDDRARREGISRIEAEAIMEKEEGKKSPLGRVGELQDVASIVTFLASSHASFITGMCFNVDGGITRSIL